MEIEKPKRPNKALIAIIVVVVLAAAAAAVVILSNKAATPSQEETASTKTTAETSNTTAQPSGEVASASYKDGSYTATSTYQTPGGVEKLTVKISLAGGVIETVDVTGSPTTNEAEEYQGKFKSGYKTEVVGKNIGAVNLSRVAGSSLTPNGFNQALDQIKSDAKA